MAEQYMILPFQDHLKTVFVCLIKSDCLPRILMSTYMFIAPRVYGKFVLLSVQPLIQEKHYAQAVCHIMSMARIKTFEKEELLQCTWSCKKRHASCGPNSQFIFFSDGTCAVDAQRVEYDIVANRYRNGAYATTRCKTKP